ncbi:FDD123 protein [Immersiella caudata]|uniref:FDD123 protein n=1 Tax=Immersiella caudata TaxID=314043 RepID=A0AA39XF24_9PEZI|nr:FDD123 protein [Immersiella caudata]
MSGNHAIDANAGIAPQATIAITSHGSDLYFTVCAIMGAATLVIWLLSLPAPASHRIFHNLLAGATFISCIANFAMGSNLGQTPVITEFRRSGTREVFYARYIEWIVTAPLLLSALLLTARVPVALIVGAIGASWVAIACGLIGALVPTSYKWGFATFGVSALLFVFWQVLWDGRRLACAVGGPVRKTYTSSASILVFIWMLYPVAWGLAEGGNVIHPDSEAVFYGVLDIFAKVVFAAVLLEGQRGVAPEMLAFGVRDARPLAGGGRSMAENLNYRNQLSSGDENPNAVSVNTVEQEEAVHSV